MNKIFFHFNQCGFRKSDSCANQIVSMVHDIAQKIKFSIKNLFSITQFPADLITFTEEILNEKLYFLCNMKRSIPFLEGRSELFYISEAFDRVWSEGSMYKLKTTDISGHSLKL